MLYHAIPSKFTKSEYNTKSNYEIMLYHVIPSKFTKSEQITQSQIILFSELCLADNVHMVSAMSPIYKQKIRVLKQNNYGIFKNCFIRISNTQEVQEKLKHNTFLRKMVFGCNHQFYSNIPDTCIYYNGTKYAEI